MKKIGILTGYQHIFNKKLESSTILKNIFAANGLELIRVSYHDFDIEKQIFTSFVDQVDGKYQIINDNIKPDVLRKKVTSSNQYCYDNMLKYSIVPTSRYINISSNKFETYLFLKKFQPQTAMLESFLNNNIVQKEFLDKVLIKPIFGNSGKGIDLFDKDVLLEQQEKYKGLANIYIVQDFKDFSKGYGSNIDGIHDIRMVYLGGKFSHCSVRQPAVGSFKSNLGSGGSEFGLDMSDIPTELFQISEEIMKILNFSELDLGSFDFAYCADEQRWYLLEINFSLGLFYGKEAMYLQEKYFQDLVIFFKNI